MSARTRIGLVAALGAAATLLLVAAFFHAVGVPLGAVSVPSNSSGNPDDATYVPLTGVEVDDSGEDGGFSPATDDEGDPLPTEDLMPSREPAPWTLPKQWPSYPPVENPYEHLPYRDAPNDGPSDPGPGRGASTPPDGKTPGGDPSATSAPPRLPAPVEPAPAPEEPGTPPAEEPVEQAPDPGKAFPPAAPGDGAVGGGDGGSEPAPAVPPPTEPVDPEPAPDPGSPVDGPAPAPPPTDVIEGIVPPPADLVPEKVKGPREIPQRQDRD